MTRKTAQLTVEARNDGYLHLEVTVGVVLTPQLRVTAFGPEAVRRVAIAMGRVSTVSTLIRRAQGSASRTARATAKITERKVHALQALDQSHDAPAQPNPHVWYPVTQWREIYGIPAEDLILISTGRDRLVLILSGDRSQIDEVWPHVQNAFMDTMDALHGWPIPFPGSSSSRRRRRGRRARAGGRTAA